MARAQIHLETRDLELLKRAEARTGASRSELVRRAVRAIYGHERSDGGETTVEDLARFAQTFGDLADEEVMRGAWR